MKSNYLVYLVILILVLLNCKVSKDTVNEKIELKYSPAVGAEYELNSNINMAIDMSQSINLNMDFTTKLAVRNVVPNKSFVVQTEILRVKSIVSSSIFHRSYDSENPIIENKVEQEMHDKFSRILNLPFFSKQDMSGESIQTSNYDSIFEKDKEIRKQFEEINRSLTLSGLKYPKEKVGKGGEWTQEVTTYSSIYPISQKLRYQLLRFDSEKAELSLEGDIEVLSDKIDGKGTIKGKITINRNTGFVVKSKITQVIRMMIGTYSASSVSTTESSCTQVK